MTTDRAGLDRSVRRCVEALAGRGETVASCESLTGGLVGSALTSVPGVSAVYRGGLISYATDLKATLAGVDEALLSRHGAVAAPTAIAMARGAARLCCADWGLATTGVAGPDPQEGHPPGTVFVAVAHRGEQPTDQDQDRDEVVRLSLIGPRETVRQATVASLFELFERRLGCSAPDAARP